MFLGVCQYVLNALDKLLRFINILMELEGKKAKRTMLGCYMTRYGVLFVLCAGAMLTKAVSAVGILLPQFYPRIILYVIQIRERRDK